MSDHGTEMHDLEREGRAVRCHCGVLYVVGAKHLRECKPPCEQASDHIYDAMKAVERAARAAETGTDLWCDLTEVHQTLTRLLRPRAVAS